MYEKLLKAVTGMGAPRVLLVGDFILDSYVYGDALRISPEAPVQVLRVVERQHLCGGAGSVAADLAALGAVPTCVGIIGDDTAGRELSGQLEGIGADIDGLLTVPGRPTVSKQRLIGLAQHRHRQQLLRIDEEDDSPIDARTTEKLLAIYADKLERADIVCLQDYNKGVLCEELCAKLISMAKQAGKKVLADPAAGVDYARYAGAYLLTPNRRETSAAVGFDIVTIDDAARAAKTLAGKLDLQVVVVTLDKEGAFLHTGQLAEHISTVPRSVYDVTGAGDMVLAMLAVSIAAGCDSVTAVQLANMAGGLEVEKFGTATVTIDEIVNEIIAENRGKMGKIRQMDSLLNELNSRRRQNETVVFTNGCFDVIHRGHIEYLKFCKQQGDIVVLGLNSDSSVRQIKGPGRPINNQHDRAAVLAGLEAVDYIITFEEPDPLKLIEQVKPDVLIKGNDWAQKGVAGREFVESIGGKVVLAPMVDGKSSTDTIEKMRSLNGGRRTGAGRTDDS